MPSSITQPRRADPKLLTALFLAGAPIGVLWMMVQKAPAGWGAALLFAVYAGAISVAWAAIFIKERWWWFALLLPAQVLLPNLLYNAGQRLGILDLGMDLPAQTRIIVLAVLCVVFSISGFTLFVVHLRRTERRSARVHAELELAQQVHRTLVPPIELSSQRVSVYGRSLPSGEMGGDLIDAVAEGEKVDVYVGDVSGHGVGAGVVMALLKGCVRTRMLRGADLVDIVVDANRVLGALTSPGTFATFAALRVQGDGAIQYVLAGHLPILHFRAASADWARYPNASLPLGVDAEETFSSGSAAAGPGDVLALFTDGLLEVRDAKGVELGLERLAQELARHADEPLASHHAAVMDAVRAWGAPMDDQSLILLRVG